MPKAKTIDTPDTTEVEAAPDVAPPPFHAHLEPAVPPQWNAATDDPAHPLHHHGKRDSLESPEPAKD